MYPHEKIEEKRIVLDNSGQDREIITETTRTGQSEIKLSPGTIGLILIITVIIIGIVFYVVSNKNANEAANRETAAQLSREQASPPSIQQPQQAPIIVQQPAPAQQAPVIVQQPVQTGSGVTIDDATMQEVATKRLADDPTLASVSVAIHEGQAVLTGTVNSAASKVAAEQLVRTVRGVKSVDNHIVLSN